MFVLMKESNIDGYYSAYDRLIACSSEYEVIEDLEMILHKEKDLFLKSLESVSAQPGRLPPEFQQSEFKKFKNLSRYFNSYIEVVNGYFNFEITQVPEI